MSVSLLEFLSVFFPHPNEPICLRAFAPKGAPDRPEYQPTKVTVTWTILANHKAGLVRLNKTRGLYFAPNSGGDTDAAITRFNAVFCENDQLSLEEQHKLLDTAPLPTSIRIETLKSVHAYWLLKRGCTEAEWRELQARLLAHFGGDPKIKNPSRVMRLPYFNHVSLNGDGSLHFKQVELVRFEPARRYSAEELLKAFSVPDSEEEVFGQSGKGSGNYQTWDDLNVEVRRRIASHPTAKKRPDGWIRCKGICHGGRSDSAIALNPATGAYRCQAGCETGDILKAFGLPEKPEKKEATATAKGPGDWEEPLPLNSSVPEPELLTPELLPEAFRPWLFDVAERMNVPLDYPAAAAIVALSAVVGRRARVRPKEKDTWEVVPNLWGAVIGRPGTQKTPAISEGMAALLTLEKGAQEAFEQEKNAYAREVERFNIDREAWREMAKRAKKSGKGYEDFCKDKPKEPSGRRYITNDATAEKLHELLRNNRAGILYFRDELTGWLAAMEKPERTADRSFLLEGWNGDQGQTIDRIGRGTIYAPVCCVSVFGGIQPSRLRAYLADAATGGLSDDGLLQRLQVLVWPEVSEQFNLVDRKPDREAQASFAMIFERLASLNPDEPVIRHFTPEAQELFYVWWPELEIRVRSNRLAESFIAHLGKYRSLMPSLALLFMLADWALIGGDIPAVSLPYAQLAAAWCACLESHAVKMYSHLMRGGLAASQVLAEKIQSGALPQVFAARDVYRQCWSGLTTPEEVEKAATILVDCNWLRQKENKSTGGRPARTYRVNPKVRGTEE